LDDYRVSREIVYRDALHRAPSFRDNDRVWAGRATSSDLVKQQLERVLQSKAFRNAEALSRLLRFIVERTLEGDTEGLKEYSLGSEVLGRGPGFDAHADPIVRVQAGRLRSKLDGYYHTEGKNDPLRIDCPGVATSQSSRAPSRRQIPLPGTNPRSAAHVLPC